MISQSPSPMVPSIARNLEEGGNQADPPSSPGRPSHRATVASRQASLLPAQGRHFMRSHFNDMYPVHTVKICCPGALFPLVVGVVGIITWYLGEAGARSLNDTE